MKSCSEQVLMVCGWQDVKAGRHVRSGWRSGPAPWPRVERKAPGRATDSDFTGRGGLGFRSLKAFLDASS